MDKLNQTYDQISIYNPRFNNSVLEDSEISLIPYHLLSNYYKPDTVPGLGIQR